MRPSIGPRGFGEPELPTPVRADPSRTEGGADSPPRACAHARATRARGFTTLRVVRQRFV